MLTDTVVLSIMNHERKRDFVNAIHVQHECGRPQNSN
jgi:hypothetical protein